MLQKTRGIVLRHVKYGESSLIVTVFTDALGLQTYMVNGVRSTKKSIGKAALFQPLTLLDLVVYHKENASIQRISEVRCHFPFQTIALDIKKTTIAIFLSEVLNKTIREHTPNHDLFDFILHSIQVLDHLERDFENFHLQFMLKLSRYLGFSAEYSGEFDANPYPALVANAYDGAPKLGAAERTSAFEHILHFYRQHLDHFGELRSVSILREVLRD
jgi:DNA repair protein RecO (recombination protein O)